MHLAPTRLRGLAGLIAVGVAALIALAPAAAAHEGKAIINVETEVNQPAGTDYTIRAIWNNDGHPAADATVTATPIDPAGVNGTPIAFAARDEDGRYGGFVPMPSPGRWTVRFTVVEPAGTLEVTRDVAATTTTTAKPKATTTTTPAKKSGDPANISALFIAVGLMAVVFIVAWLMHKQSQRAKARNQ